MKYALTGLAGLIALGLVALAPGTASAGHHGGWGWGGGWGGPGFGVYVGPRYGYRSYGYGGPGLAPALFVCCSFVYFTPAQ